MNRLFRCFAPLLAAGLSFFAGNVLFAADRAVAASGRYTYRAQYIATVGDQPVLSMSVSAGAQFETRTADGRSERTCIVDRLSLSATGPDGRDEIQFHNGDSLRVSDGLVVIDTASGIGTDRAYQIHRMLTGGIALSETSASVIGSWTPDALGMLGAFLLPSVRLSDNAAVPIIRSRRLAGWRLERPQPLRIAIGPTADDDTARSPISFRLSMVGSDDARRFNLVSLTGRPLVIGAAVGRGEGEWRLKPSGDVQSATLSGSIMATIPGESENRRMTIRFTETLTAE